MNNGHDFPKSCALLLLQSQRSIGSVKQRVLCASFIALCYKLGICLVDLFRNGIDTKKL